METPGLGGEIGVVMSPFWRVEGGSASTVLPAAVGLRLLVRLAGAGLLVG